MFEKYDMKQVIDPDEIRKLCQIVIDTNPKVARRYRNGKESELGILVHKAFVKSKKRASIHLVKDTFKSLLKN